jgi:addiction module HigA family antidote
MTDKLSPIHPGEVLLEEFIKPMNLSQNRLAINIDVDECRINEIVLGKRSIIADSALRLARFFGNSPQVWMGLQARYDLDVAEDALGARLDREVRPFAAGKSGNSRLRRLSPPASPMIQSSQTTGHKS